MLEGFERQFRPDLIDAVNKVGRKEAFWSSGSGMIGKLIGAIAKSRPRLSINDQSTIQLIATDNFKSYGYHEPDFPGRLTDYELSKIEVETRYYAAEKSACSAFSFCDTGREEIDLLTLVEIVSLLAYRSWINQTEPEFMAMLNRLEKFYFKKVENNTRLIDNRNRLKATIYGGYSAQGDPREEAFSTVLGVINRLHFIENFNNAFSI